MKSLKKFKTNSTQRLTPLLMKIVHRKVSSVVLAIVGAMDDFIPIFMCKQILPKAVQYILS